MKRRIMSVVLSVAMALSLAVPAMAVTDGEKAETGKVLIENVPGGVVEAFAYNWDGDGKNFGKDLPIGETVELPVGTTVTLNASPHYYYNGEGTIISLCDEINVATAANGSKVALWKSEDDEDMYDAFCSFEVEAGVTTIVTGAFKEKSEGGGSSAEDREASMSVENSFKTIPTIKETSVGSMDMGNLYFYTYSKEYDRWTRIPISWKDVNVRLQRVRNRGNDVTDYFEYEEGKIIWNGPLSLGEYNCILTVNYQGDTYQIHCYIQVGYSIDLAVPVAIWCEQNGEYGSYYNVIGTRHGIGDTGFCEGTLVVSDFIKQVTGSSESENAWGLYGYDLARYALFDYETGSFKPIDVKSTIQDIVGKGNSGVEICALFEKNGKEYKPVLISRLGTADTTLDTVEELEDAIEELPTTTDTSADAKTFDAGVAEIVDGMKKLKDEKAQMAIANALGTKLKDVLNLKLAPGDVTADDSIFVALGLTSSKDKDKTVELVVTNVATSSNASRVGEFTVEVKINGETHSGTLSVPVEVTIELPADMVASMANAGKQYVVVIGGKEIPAEYDETTNTIKFTTSVLGHFIIREKTKETTGSSGTVTGLTGGHRKSTKTDLNASGTWVHDDKGWWFKYTSGGYPASKWEMIKNKWYYFNADGYMATGWQLIGNSWYHLDEVNGDRTTGWYLDAADGKWYYFNSSGVMQTGWKLIKEKYYYLSPESAAPTYTYDAAAQKWVYTNTKARPYGSMYANEVTPDGYTVDANGVWVQ